MLLIHRDPQSIFKWLPLLLLIPSYASEREYLKLCKTYLCARVMNRHPMLQKVHAVGQTDLELLRHKKDHSALILPEPRVHQILTGSCPPSQCAWKHQSLPQNPRTGARSPQSRVMSHVS